MTPETILLAGVAGLIAWAVGHYGTSSLGAAWAKAKTAAANAEHAASQTAANDAVKAITWLTDKSRQQAVIAKAQSEMATMDALLAHVLTQLPKPPGA